MGARRFREIGLYVAGAAIVVGIALWAYFRFAKIGLATRAAAESERNAALGGWSPDLLGASTWAIASVVSTLLVIVTLPILPLSQTLHTLMIVPALACALVGRLTSIAGTVVAAMSLGVLQSVLAYESTQSWWPEWAQTGLNDAVPFIVLIVVLFVLGPEAPDACDAAAGSITQGGHPAQPNLGDRAARSPGLSLSSC